MKKIIIMLLALTLLLAGIVGLSSCNLEDNTQDAVYRLDSSDFQTVVAFGEEIDYSSLYIYRNEDKFSVESSMITSAVDTSKLGSQELGISFEGHSFTVKVNVKYKAEFIVDGEVWKTEYIISPLELTGITPPEKEGKISSGWTPEIPDTTTGNMVFEAVYAEAIPSLTEINAEYSDKISNIVLPANEFGKWEFVKSNGKLLSLGKQQFDVRFVDLATGEVIKTDTLTVNVARKKVIFSNINSTYEYNGERQIPTFETNVPVPVIFLDDGVSNYTDAGTYDYYFEVDDPNYEGFVQGKYVIEKANVTIKVNSYTILASDEPPKIEYQISGFERVTLLGITVTDPKDVVEGPGTYTLTASVANPNVIANIIDGTLTVESTTLDVGAPKLSSSTATYEDLLSSITFESSIYGKWSWKEDPTTTTVGNAGTNIHVAVFTPTDLRYDPTETNVEIEVLKKTLIITVTGDNTFNYDGNEHNLTYTVKDSNGKDYSHINVSGNTPKTNAGAYTLTLKINDSNYTGMKSASLVINKINPTGV